MTYRVRDLTESDLLAVSGGRPNLGGYNYCNVPGRQEGLYVGPCVNDNPTWGQLFDIVINAIHNARGGRPA